MLVSWCAEEGKTLQSNHIFLGTDAGIAKLMIRKLAREVGFDVAEGVFGVEGEVDVIGCGVAALGPNKFSA